MIAKYSRLMVFSLIYSCLVLSASTDAAEASGKGMWRGVFEPNAQAIIPSEVAMPVIAMPKLPGDSCTEGDVLVEFDSTLPEAGLASARAKMRAVELNHSGMQSLFDKNQATAVELAEAESRLAQARLEVAAAEKEVQACIVRAPFSGKVVERLVRQYEWASKGAPLLLLLDDTVLQVRFFLPEEHFSAIAIGDTVRVWVPAASQHAWGKVTRLGVVFDPVSRTFDVWADVPNDDDAFRTGMTAEVEWPVTQSGSP